MGDADIDIWMWGWIETPINVDNNNIMFMFGHPAMMLEFLNKSAEGIKVAFKKWFVSSKQFSTHMKKEFKIDSEFLQLPAPVRPPVEYNPKVDLSHVGNTDMKKRRHLISDPLKNHTSIVYGPGWDTIIPNWRGEYIHWDHLHEVWQHSKIVLHSEHEDMMEWGFVADSVLDAILNSDAVVLGDSPLQNLHADEDMVWKTVYDLESKIDKLLKDETLLKETATKQRERFSAFHGYDYAAKRLLECA